MASSSSAIAAEQQQSVVVAAANNKKPAKAPLVCGDGAPFGKVAKGSRLGQRVTKRIPCLYRAYAEKPPLQNAPEASETGAEKKDSTTAEAEDEEEQQRSAAAANLNIPRLYPSSPKWHETPLKFAKLICTENFSRIQNAEVPIDAISAQITAAAAAYQSHLHRQLAAKRLAAQYYGREEEAMTMAEHEAIAKAAGHTVVANAAAAAAEKKGTDAGDKFTFAQLIAADGPIAVVPIGCDGAGAASNGSGSIAAVSSDSLNLKVDFAVRCHWCAATIDLTDPPVCECGEFFCSEECQECDFTASRGNGNGNAMTSSACTQSRMALQEASVLSCNQHYWNFCLKGVLRWPHDELKNYSLAWRADKKISDTKSLKFMFEFDYLVEKEKAAMEAQIAARRAVVEKYLKSASVESMGSKEAFEEGFGYRTLGVALALATQYSRMVHCQPEIDSSARIRFRMMMIEQIWEQLTKLHGESLVKVNKQVALSCLEEVLAEIMKMEAAQNPAAAAVQTAAPAPAPKKK